MKPRIAISAPMTVPMEHLREVKELIQLRYEIPGNFISFWDRKSAYDQNVFNNAEAVVVILNDFAFDSSKSDYIIPIGVHRELQEADKQHKNVFLAYKRKTDGVLNLYNATYLLGRGNDYKSTQIKGSAGYSGSADKFKDWINDRSRIESTIKKWESLSFDAKSITDKALEMLGCNEGGIHSKRTNGIADQTNLCSEISLDTSQETSIKFPESLKVFAQTVSRHQFDTGFDERLLLML